MNKTSDQNPERGQEINVKFKNNRGKNPDGEEALEKDLIQLDDASTDDDGQVVKSSDPESQEWHAREDTNSDESQVSKS